MSTLTDDIKRVLAFDVKPVHREICDLAASGARERWRMSIPVDMKRDSDMILQAPLDHITRTEAVMLAMVELIDATVRTFDSGKVMNCAFDCEYEGAHPNCSACNALARLKAEVLKAQTGGGK